MTSRREILCCTNWFLCLGLVIGLAVTQAAAAEAAAEGSTDGTTDRAAFDSAAGSSTHSITGTVVNSNATNLVISGPDGQPREFALDPGRPYGAAMFTGDQVRVHYDPTRDGETLATRVQTLNVTQSLNRPEQQRMMFAISLPPTQSREMRAAPATAQAEPLMAQATTPGTADTERSREARATATRDALPATASPVPAVAAVGAALLAASAGVGLMRRKRGGNV